MSALRFPPGSPEEFQHRQEVEVQMFQDRQRVRDGMLSAADFERYWHVEAFPPKLTVEERLTQLEAAVKMLTQSRWSPNEL